MPLRANLHFSAVEQTDREGGRGHSSSSLHHIPSTPLQSSPHPGTRPHPSWRGQRGFYGKTPESPPLLSPIRAPDQPSRTDLTKHESLYPLSPVTVTAPAHQLPFTR